VAEILYGVRVWVPRLLRSLLRLLVQHFWATKQRFTEEHVCFMKKKLRDNAYCIALKQQAYERR
jgi:hypothetical protein